MTHLTTLVARGVITVDASGVVRITDEAGWNMVTVVPPPPPPPPPTHLPHPRRHTPYD